MQILTMHAAKSLTQERISPAPKLLVLLEKIYVVISLLLFTSAILPLLQKQSGDVVDTVQGNPMMQLIWFAIYAISICWCLSKWRLNVQLMRRDTLLFLLIMFAICSVFWSYAPDLTLRRSIALLGTTMFGVYFANRFSLQEQLHLLAWTLGLAGILSVFFALALPSYGIYTEERGEVWQGIYSHKNTLGRIMTLSSILFLLYACFSNRSKWVIAGGGALSVSLILLSTSKTALVILLTLVLVFVVLFAVKRGHPLIFPFVVVISLMFAFSAWMYGEDAWVLLGLALDGMGRDLTLTGRTELWSSVMEMIAQRPWLGYGYNAFWLGMDGESANVWLVTGWEPPNSHNGFLDVSLDLGLLGVSLFILGYAAAVKRAIDLVRNTQTIENFFPILYLLFMFLYSLTEATILIQNSIFWVLYVSVSLTISNANVQ